MLQQQQQQQSGGVRGWCRIGCSKASCCGTAAAAVAAAARAKTLTAAATAAAAAEKKEVSASMLQGPEAAGRGRHRGTFIGISSFIHNIRDRDSKKRHQEETQGRRQTH